MAKRVDPNQPSFFETPAQPAERPGDANINIRLREGLARAIKECPLSRVELAARMTLLIFGDTVASEVTKASIDAWTAQSRDAWRFPLEFLPAFIQVTKAYWLLDWVAEACGCKIMVGEEASLAELGAVNVQMRQLKQREAEIRAKMPPEVLRRLLPRKGDGK